MFFRCIFGVLGIIPCLAFTQKAEEAAKMPRLSKISVSVNPAGFLFFGPTADVGIRLSEKSVLNLNVRKTSWGMITHKIKQEKEEMGGINGLGVGAGITGFKSSSGKGLFYGAQLGLDKLSVNYSPTEPWRWYEDVKSIAFGLNGGYRIVLSHGLFINAGGYFGAVYSDSHWDYYDPSQGTNDFDPRDTKTFLPVGMLEFSIGLGFD